MMNANWFYALTANGRSLAENAKEAGTVTLLGMTAIFAVLALLWLVIELLHRALTEKREAVEREEATPAEAVSTEEIVPEAPVSEPAPAADDGALIAAITAAISAAMADEGYTGGFRVVSFKRATVRRNGRA